MMKTPQLNKQHSTEPPKAALLVSEDKKKRLNAKQRGTSFEYSIAKLLGGKRHLLSRAGDVETETHSIECKYRKDAEGLKTLQSFIEQSKKDAKALNKKWAVALSFGETTGGYMVIPAKEFAELLRGKE
jgi:hypothetical protein